MSVVCFNGASVSLDMHLGVSAMRGGTSPEQYPALDMPHAHDCACCNVTGADVAQKGARQFELLLVISPLPRGPSVWMLPKSLMYWSVGQAQGPLE